MIPDQADISTLSKLYHSGAWIPLGILVAFFALRASASRVAWLKEDHRAVWVAAILGGLATLIVPATQGETPNLSMIGAALMTVMALHADPKKTAVEQKQAQGGFVSRWLLGSLAAIGLVLGLLAAPSCAGAQKLEQNGLACAGKQVTWALLAQVTADLVQDNYFALLTQLAITEGKATIDCIVTTAIAAQPPAATGTGAASALLPPIVEHGNVWLSGMAK